MYMTTLTIDSGPLVAPSPDASGVRAYLGLPYAAPPVGSLRWRTPQPVAPWREPRPADAFGPCSLQGRVWDDIDLRGAGVSEDCLYLNVWTSAAPGAGERRAVLFYIHGGGFVAGSGSEPRYDGARLAARGIVVVTVNYRLNALGFLAHPELTAEQGFSGNFGLIDLVAALEWVQRNIAALGGDPARVTIGGESAGSMAVCALMASPLARGLFVRAIGQSGALFAGAAEPLPDLAQAQERGLAFQRELSAKSLAEMRAAPAEAILAAAPGLGFRPIVDGRFLPRPLDAIFADGGQADAPLLAGWTKDEGFNFTLTPGGEAEGAYERQVAERFGADAGEVLARYPGGPQARASAAALGGDLVIVNKTWAWIEAQKASGRADIYRYRFDRDPPVRPGWFGARDAAQAGAFHAGDIPYVLDTLDAMPWDFVAADRAAAEAAAGYWVNFVKSGDPNGPGLPRWPSFRDGGEVMLIDGECRAAPEEGRARQAFLRDLTRRLADRG
jgi:para-nitrobenzyl esterase